MKTEDKVFLKIMLVSTLVATIIYCCIWAVTLVVESQPEEQLTECESMCYPDDVDEESTDCMCLPPIEAR
jgi:hypothetical protein